MRVSVWQEWRCIPLWAFRAHLRYILTPTKKQEVIRMEIRVSIKLFSHFAALQKLTHSVFEAAVTNLPSAFTNRNYFERSLLRVSEFPISSHSTQRGMCHHLCRGVTQNCTSVCVLAHAYAYGTNTQRREINKTTRKLSADGRRGHRRRRWWCAHVPHAHTSSRAHTKQVTTWKLVERQTCQQTHEAVWDSQVCFKN